MTNFEAHDEDFDPAGTPVVEVPRDRWDRPLIKQPVGNPIPYSRISTVAQYINPSHALGVWKQRHIALAVSRRPDICDLLRTMTYQDKSRLDLVIEEALTRAKDDDTDADHKLLAANKGTTFHEYVGSGVVPDHTYGYSLADYKIASERFYSALYKARLEIVSAGQFVVNDELKIAGTYDHLVRNLDTGFCFIMDEKTGSLHWSTHAAQLDGYARSAHYDPATGIRSPLVDEGELITNYGLIAATNLATGECKIYPVDLSGRPMDIAAGAHRYGSSKNIKAIVGAPLN